MFDKQTPGIFRLFLILSILALLVGCGGGGGGGGVNVGDGGGGDGGGGGNDGGGDGGGEPLSSNADMASLTISNGQLNPSFSSSISAYATMFVVQSSITLTPTAADAGATIEINGTSVTSGQMSSEITLDPGENDITVLVTAEDGVTTKIYSITASYLSQQAYIKASNTGEGDRFGYSVAISGDTLAVGTPYEDSNATGVNDEDGQSDDNAFDSGAVYVFTRTGDTWTQQAYIKASNADAGDRFGYSVALSGDTLAVGAPGEDSNATGVNDEDGQSDDSAFGSGAVYVFTRTGDTWTQQAYIKASNTGEFDNFGARVALSGDTLAVGAPDEDSNATGVNDPDGQSDDNAFDSGAVYVFTRTGDTWTQQAYIKASNTDADDQFGRSVAISGDTLAVGAPEEASNATGVNDEDGQSDDSAAYSGAVYVFTRTGDTWTQQAYIKASNTGAGDNFGYSVALSGDTLAVGGPGEASNATGVNAPDGQLNGDAAFSGAVYVFTRTGDTWTQQAYIKASNTDENDLFGYSVALSGDTLAVGATLEASNATGVNAPDGQSDDSALESGAAYILR